MNAFFLEIHIFPGVDHSVSTRRCEASVQQSLEVYKEKAPLLYTASEHVRRKAAGIVLQRVAAWCSVVQWVAV